MPMSVLMCAPDYFDIEYEINPWMHTDDKVNPEEAKKQWQNLHRIYAKELGWKVKLIEPVENLPDMVFTANGGLVFGGKVALPTFRQPDRQPETAKFKLWFKDAGYTEILTTKYDFEGEGDALVWNEIIFAGYPWRSDRPAHDEISEFFDAKVVSLRLADPRFYHLDTCLTIVDKNTVALWPPAFAPESVDKIKHTVPNVIEASEQDALAYGLNAMIDGQNIVLSDKAHGLIEKYKKRGMNPIPTPISEFQKSGGGVKCLTLELR